MKLLLHTLKDESSLSSYYHRAFNEATELFIVTAYLTEWNTSLKLNSKCRRFRLIIGKDFGITRIAACQKVINWLPAKRKGQFLVADLISGFHPKAIFWKESDDNFYSIIGSSNLTKAAFETNYEANVFSEISNDEYDAARRWVRTIEKQSIPVSGDWLKNYHETSITGRKSRNKNDKESDTALAKLHLPNPAAMRSQINIRRKQLSIYKENQNGLIKLFQQCAEKKIDSINFYNELPNYWSYEIGDRLQGAGWERQGRNSNFQILSESYIRVLNASDEDRDDVVEEEIDTLHEQNITTRKAFLSEMLCLQFPDQYPVLNKPVLTYLKSIKYVVQRGASEGARYIDLARKLRASLLLNPSHAAKNLAELDCVIWLAFGQE